MLQTSRMLCPAPGCSSSPDTGSGSSPSWDPSISSPVLGCARMRWGERTPPGQDSQPPQPPPRIPLAPGSPILQPGGQDLTQPGPSTHGRPWVVLPFAVHAPRVTCGRLPPVHGAAGVQDPTLGCSSGSRSRPCVGTPERSSALPVTVASGLWFSRPANEQFITWDQCSAFIPARSDGFIPGSGI